MKAYMFDTNIFDEILNREIDMASFISKARFYATHVQFDEINKTPDEEKKAKLLKVFKEATALSVPTETFVLDISQLDGAKLSGESFVPTESAVYGISKNGLAKYSQSNNKYKTILSMLDKLRKKDNNMQDALIAETAIINKYILVTHDKNLLKVVTELGAPCEKFHQVLQELE